MSSKLRLFSAVLISAFVALTTFVVLNRWLPALYASAIAILTAGLAALLALVGTGLDWVKKGLEIAKLRGEVRDKHQQNKDSNRLILPATAEEIENYGSYKQRKLAVVFRREREKEDLEMKRFIAALDERRIRG